MNKIIELKAKGEEHNYLRRLNRSDGSESKTYVLIVTNSRIKSAEIDGHKSINPVGGPIITEGEILEEAEAVVKSIDYISGFGFTVTFL